jgi:hypothetical protein
MTSSDSNLMTRTIREPVDDPAGGSFEPRLQPLTERLLARLPGAHAVWVLVWALVPWANAGANLLLETGARSAIWEESAALVVVNYAALSFGVAITVWGTGRIARRVESLHETTSLDVDDASNRFREINSVAGPLTCAAAVALAFATSAFVADGWPAGILRGITWFVLGIPLWSFLWTYGVLQLGLHRLSRDRLLPDAARVDPTLGVRPLGAVAGMGLWMLLVWLVPVVLSGLTDVVGVVIGVGLLASALAAFFLPLVRLHRQMVEVKEGELAIARELYAEAYQPVREERTLDALERQHRLLGAADALEKRAHALHEWPIDEGTLARVITITTSVIAMTVARIILDPFGL